MVRALVVEDEIVMARALAKGLRSRGFAVDVAGDGAFALDLTATHAYDLVLLDRDLPAVHGDDVCRALREAGSSVRILMLTAADDVADRVTGLRLGADDYLGKPFAFEELMARVEALLRRAEATFDPVLSWGEVRIDTAHRSVTRAGREVELTLKQYGLLVELVRAQGRAVPAETLLEKVWDEHADPFSGVVKVTMSGLRRALGDPPLIENLRGVGYRITA